MGDKWNKYDVLKLLEREGIIRSIAPMPIAVKPSDRRHGACCYCSTCNHTHDDCVCETNEMLAALDKLETFS